jgi:hypothetical protein
MGDQLVDQQELLVKWVEDRSVDQASDPLANQDWYLAERAGKQG